MKVLLVDDEYLELEQLKYLIHSRYPMWDLYTAEDSAEAKKLIKHHSFPLSFIDVHLPGESGLDLAQKLKQSDSSMEIIIVTAFQDFNYAKRAIQLNAIDYLVKPIIEKELFDVIESYIRNHSYFVAKTNLVQHVIDRIHNDFSKKLNLRDMADEIPVNVAYLSKRFSEEVGMNFKDYLIKYRIEKAKNIIQSHPNWNMIKVSEAVGFSSQHHFSNSFRRIEHTTPTQYRERLL